VATRGRTFKRPWRRSCLSSKLKSSSAPIGRKDSWCFHAVGSWNAPLLGSTAAEGLRRIGRTSIATRWRSCGLPQFASCSENSVIPPDVSGPTLSKRRSFDSIDIVRRRDRRRTPVSVLEALRSRKYTSLQRRSGNRQVIERDGGAAQDTIAFGAPDILAFGQLGQAVSSKARIPCGQSVACRGYDSVGRGRTARPKEYVPNTGQYPHVVERQAAGCQDLQPLQNVRADDPIRVRLDINQMADAEIRWRMPTKAGSPARTSSVRSTSLGCTSGAQPTTPAIQS
jgi:hypothetical protein